MRKSLLILFVSGFIFFVLLVSFLNKTPKKDNIAEDIPVIEAPSQDPVEANNVVTSSQFSPLLNPLLNMDCVREITAELIFSKPLRDDIDENIRKGIEEALDKNGGGAILWVSLNVDFDMLIDELKKYDTNTTNIAIYGSSGFGNTMINPTILKHEQVEDWQGRFLKSEILFNFSEENRMMSIMANNISLARFAFINPRFDYLKDTAIEKNNVFPKIKPAQFMRALSVITSYAKINDLKPLAKNHMRYFEQPWGIVSRCVDVNLVSGEMLSYPGTHDISDVKNITISSKEIEDILSILKSKEFIRVPQENNKVGADGSSVFIEVDIDGSYLWKSHWMTEDLNFINTMNKIGEILRPYGIDIGIPLPQSASINGSPD